MKYKLSRYEEMQTRKALGEQTPAQIQNVRMESRISENSAQYERVQIAAAEAALLRSFGLDPREKI